MNAGVLATSVRLRLLAHSASWATVTKIVDGDTVWVDLDGDATGHAKGRYLGIDTPQIHFAVAAHGPEMSRIVRSGK